MTWVDERSKAYTVAGVLAVVAGCGRTGLLLDPRPEKSSAFCASSDYQSGFTDLSIFVVLDKSDSMNADNKWDQATVALSAFVDDPLTAGLGMGLQYFPLGSGCNEAQFAIPAVVIGLLPNNGPAIKASLAQQKPFGETPTLPALRAGVIYAQASMLADPSRRVVVALVTDGAPNACESTTKKVADVALEAASGQPQVLTFVIGIEGGYIAELEKIATAGGTGMPIVLREGQPKAQQFIDALKEIQHTQAECRYALPATGAESPIATDLSVSVRLSPGEPPVELLLVDDENACPTSSQAFFVDHPSHPAKVILCPEACHAVHASRDSRVTVTAGCGAGSTPAAPGTPGPGGDDCGGSVDFICTPSCGSSLHEPPICVGGDWACPPGTVSTVFCASCSAVPHACCKPDGTLVDATCVNGAWVCPPAALMYGTPGCSPPEVCSRTLPCSVDQICTSPDYSCGTSTVAGQCAAIPSSCPAPDAPACGCDGNVHASSCEAAASGEDLAGNETCTAPAAMFACGPFFCRLADQVCKETVHLSQPLGLSSYQCIPLPPGCPTGCGCNLCEPCAGIACTENCSIDPGTGGHFLMCTEL